MDNIVVGVRVRPLNEREKSAPDFSHAWHVTNKTVQRTVSARQNIEPLKFAYDSVFEPTSTNEDVYNSIASPIVEAALGGFNATIFAYGQTSSGKTHTMLGSEQDQGVTPRAIEHVLRHAAASKTRTFHVRASYVEIYNDKIHDLQNASRTDLAIRQDKAGRIYVEAEETIVQSLDDAMNILEVGQRTRHVGGTNMNARSSRSHTVFSLLIESKDSTGADGTIRASTLNLVDLAGSERLKSTGAEGKRAKEGAHINKSLLVLGTIINKLSKFGNDPSKLGHLPYRESKLTRLLRPALGGNAKTAVLCAVTPSNLHVEETISTLKFAERAKKISNNVSRNEITDYRAKYKATAVELAVLQEKYAALEAEHNSLKKSGVSPTQQQAQQQAPPESPISPASTLTDVSTKSEDVPVVVSAPSMAEVVGLRLDVENLKEELEYMKKHVDEVEIENEHLRAQMRKKNSDYRDLRTRTVDLRATARLARQKERETSRALVMAFAKLEEARAQLEASRKKGSHVKVAETLLDELSQSLLDWLPQGNGNSNQSQKRRSSGSGSGLSGENLSMVPMDARAKIAADIGRDSQRGKAIAASFASMAHGTLGDRGTQSAYGALPGLPAPERRRRARTLPEDLVMDIDESPTRKQSFVSPTKSEDDVYPEDDTATISPRSSEVGSELVGEDEAVNGKMRGWKSFKAFYGYGLSRGSIFDELISGHQITASSKHLNS